MDSGAVMAQGWTPVPEPQAAPAGWTPVEPPVFRGTNERDEQGNAVVRPSVGGFAENVVSSGIQFGQNVAQPFMHPIDTIKGIVAAASQPGESGRAMLA